MRCIRHLLVALLVWVVLPTSAQHPESVEVSVTVVGDADEARAVPMRDPGPPATESSHLNDGQTSPGTSHQGGRREPKSEASLVVLQKELETLEAMIELQNRKMQTLEKMRTALLDKSDATGHDELGLSQAHRTRRAPRSEYEAAVDRKLEAVAAQVLAREATGHFDTHSIEKARVDLDGDIADIKMAKIHTLPTHDLVVVGSRSGLVKILLPSGRELLRIDTRITDLSSLDLDTAADPSLLVAMSNKSLPRIRVFVLTVKLPEKAFDAQRPLPQTSSFSTVDIALSFAELPMSSTALDGATSAAISRSSRRSILSVAHSDGTLGFYALNGSLVHSVATGSPNVTTLAIYRHLVAFANGTNVVVFPLTRQKVPDYNTCEGSLASVSSIAFDPVHADVVFAGTIDGELLVFAVTRNSESSHCRLLHRTIVGRARPLQLVAFRGHIAVASSKEIHIYSVSRLEGSATLARVCAKPIDPTNASGSKSLIAVSENGHATIIAAITSRNSGGATLMIFQSLLPSAETSTGDWMVWRGATFFAMIIIVVLATQFFLRRQQSSSSDADNEKWRELLEKHGRRDLSRDDWKSNSEAPNQPPLDPYEGDPTMYSATAETFSKSGNRKMRTAKTNPDMDEAELRRKIAEARRETLECTFDGVEEDAY